MDLVLDFTHTYPEEWILAHHTLTRIDCSDLMGTDMYCDPESEKELEKRIGKYPLKGVHFIDSGNYHYMTRLFTKRIQKPYQLLFFDNHTDCQPTMIPELLSCGAWAKQTIEEDGNLERMILIGPEDARLREIEVANREKLRTVSREELAAIEAKYEKSWKGGADCERMRHTAAEWTEPDKGIQKLGDMVDGTLPIYISIDKDVLGTDDARTNWDQGEMSLGQLKRILDNLAAICRKNGVEILGVDICGELPGKDVPAGEWQEVQDINRRTNEELYGLWRGVL